MSLVLFDVLHSSNYENTVREKVGKENVFPTSSSPFSLTVGP